MYQLFKSKTYPFVNRLVTLIHFWPKPELSYFLLDRKPVKALKDCHPWFHDPSSSYVSHHLLRATGRWLYPDSAPKFISLWIPAFPNELERERSEALHWRSSSPLDHDRRQPRHLHVSHQSFPVPNTRIIKESRGCILRAKASFSRRWIIH